MALSQQLRVRHQAGCRRSPLLRSGGGFVRDVPAVARASAPSSTCGQFSSRRRRSSSRSDHHSLIIKQHAVEKDSDLPVAGAWPSEEEKGEFVQQQQQQQQMLTPMDLSKLTQMPISSTNARLLENMGGVERVASMLDVTSLDDGLNDGDDVDMQRRKLTFGTNAVPSYPSKSLFDYIASASNDPTLLALILCAVLALFSEISTEGWATGWYDGVGILAAVVIVVAVTSFNDWNQEKQFRELDALNKDVSVNVIRNAVPRSISLYDLVVGDVVVISSGDQICTDGVVVTSCCLLVDESSMTGESDAVEKLREGFLLAGTKVLDGYGTYLVTAVGPYTEWGRLMACGIDIDDAGGQLEMLKKKMEAREITEEEYAQMKKEVEQNFVDVGRETPLQIRLSSLASDIGKLGVAVGIAVFGVLLARSGLEIVSRGGVIEPDDITQILKAAVVAVTIVVVAVPEGLPLAVTLSLAYSLKEMMADQALVRNLRACETMGSATTICSDKTGTLTTNQMVVTRAMLGACILDVPSPDETNGRCDCCNISSNLLELVSEGLFANAEGTVSSCSSTDKTYEEEEPVISGKPTEQAILRFGTVMMGMSFECANENVEKIKVVPFNSTKKRAGTAVRSKATGDVRVYWKGASEIILGLCDKEMLRDGSVSELTETRREDLVNLIADMAAGTLRTLCVAYTPCPVGTTFGDDDDLPDSGLTLLLLVGIKDPCRPGVPEAVLRCQRAGIVVRMVTGDNKATAEAIARECHILSDDDGGGVGSVGLAVEGEEFREMSYAQRIARFGPKLERLRVLARSSPSDKYDLVYMLRNLGEVVGVTGDGTNDARALKEADIGLSMGIAGTQVAQKCSDIVVLDDNFASISTIVRWGRSVYSNIQNFVQFQLTVNIVALTLNFVAAVASGEIPLNAVQLLWVNLIMDTLGALALATEPPREELMHRKPYGRTAPLISDVMWRNISVQAIFQLAVLGFMYFVLFEGDHDEHTNTFIFNTFVFMQVFNEINARRPDSLNVFDGFWKNRYFVSVLLVTVLFQILLVESTFGTVVGTTSLTDREWLTSVAVGALALPVAAIGKLAWRL
ncbi:hypothetical protein PPROV_000110900 [Pycnococcus provasolii]|uniref:Calcium-transporting ATPase n=1 Tax=Pycnococcus provasolii TaxID=41880 RepID=A0A830H711_9CHLO|nr:hypothetical protein PPROV_000110900 [Pycnococcus provasolii]